jgi:hypothetical protein
LEVEISDLQTQRTYLVKMKSGETKFFYVGSEDSYRELRKQWKGRLLSVEDSKERKEKAARLQAEDEEWRKLWDKWISLTKCPDANPGRWIRSPIQRETPRHPFKPDITGDVATAESPSNFRWAAACKVCAHMMNKKYSRLPDKGSPWSLKEIKSAGLDQDEFYCLYPEVASFETQIDDEKHSRVNRIWVCEHFRERENSWRGEGAPILTESEREEFRRNCNYYFERHRLGDRRPVHYDARPGKRI